MPAAPDGRESVVRRLEQDGNADMSRAKKDWIQGAIKHPGALHRELGVPKGEKIPAKKLEAAAKKGGTLGRRARLAETLKGFNK